MRVADLGPVAWPPEPIRTERLELREPQARDRAAVIELPASPEVGTYLGGPQPRDELERELPGSPERRPGLSQLISAEPWSARSVSGGQRGTVPRLLPGRPSLATCSCRRRGGFGYAAEACAAALGWFAGALPAEPVVLFTQTANVRSMRLAAKLGFTEVERYEAYGAEQWSGMWSPDTQSS